MITMKLSHEHLFDVAADAYAFFVEQDFIFSTELEQHSEKYFPQLRTLMNERKFTGKALSNLVVPFSLKDRVAYFVFIGLGPKEEKKAYDVELLRRATATLVRVAEQVKLSSVVFDMPAATWFGVGLEYCAKQVTVAAIMASYHFDLYFTDPAAKISRDLTITIIAPSSQDASIKKGIHEGICIADAVNATRTWIDLPPSHFTPTHLAEHARVIAQESGLKITVFDEKQVIEMGMGGLAGVSRGSEEDCQFIIMEYKTDKKNAPTLAFVGKGITFDSGGLSLKPAVAMESMKDDMAGGAAVINTMRAIAALKPDVNIIGLVPSSENLPSGKAIKPGDVLRFYNGKTAEVKNTDAEGRLILADALSYAVEHYKPDAIIDLATLTGACAHALWPFYTGMMGKDHDFMLKVELASKLSGDRVWPLPFDDDYKVAIKSSIADLCNIGSPTYRAGAITAGFFLYNFVGDTPWVHLDIAGTAFDVPDMPYYRSSGATGVGVRLLVELAMNWK